MKKLRESVNTLKEVEELLGMMSQEIYTLRNIVARYHLKYGEDIKDGVLEVPDTISFDIKSDDDGCYCVVHDYENLRITSNYKRILTKIDKLRL